MTASRQRERLDKRSTHRVNRQVSQVGRLHGQMLRRYQQRLSQVKIDLLLQTPLASKADEPAGDMLFIVLQKGLIPVTGLGLLAWGTWLSRIGKALPEMVDGADAVNGTMGDGLAYVVVALGIMLLATGYRILRR